MENREGIVSDYLKLRVMLNRPNPTRDQKTEIQFDIVNIGGGTFRLFASLKGIGKTQMLELCFRKSKFWEGSGYSGLIDLEEYCAKFLQARMPHNSNTTELRKLTLELRLKLGGLGISR